MVHLRGMSSPLDSKVTYDCNEGFKLDASQSRKLQPCVRGGWIVEQQGEAPTCKRRGVRCSAWLHRFKEEQIWVENSGLHSARSFPSAYKRLSLAFGHVISVCSVSAALTINISSAVREGGSYDITLGPSAPRPWSVHRGFLALLLCSVWRDSVRKLLRHQALYTKY